MTREEAIEFGNMWLEINEDSKNSHTYAFFQMAIQVLEQERSRLAQITQYRNDCEKLMQENEQLKKALEQEPCEDAISRAEALRHSFQIYDDGVGYKVIFADKIEQLPPVSPQTKTGRWIEHFDESGKWYECDQCHTDWGGSVNYCPNCGAKMERDSKE